MTWLIKTLERQSYVIGFVPSLLFAIAWLACGAAVARAGVDALSQYAGFAEVFVVVIAGIEGIGGLICFWILARHVSFLMSGYQIRWMSGNQWVYVERKCGGYIERLSFSRMTVGGGYPAPCEVQIASEEYWEQQAPQWAHGRRAEILTRIAESFGANSGGRVEFKDAA